ncbi:MAG: SUMF1/EgtB/PvdO family nonheme iron enzyme [Candidatus Poribacteria bacterium]
MKNQTFSSMIVKRVNLKQISPESLSKSLKTHNEYDANYYSNSPLNPTGPNTSQYRVLRGGSWGDDAGLLRIAFHLNNGPGIRSDLDGFRCVSGLN